MEKYRLMEIDGFWRLLDESGKTLWREKEPVKTRIPSGLPKGVTYCKKNNAFRAQIRVDGKVKSLGYFKTAIEAQAKYQLYLEYTGKIKPDLDHIFKPLTKDDNLNMDDIFNPKK